jgi:predicted RNA-binding Zn-ribbon protein involved in translation (DUF1610 family)
VTHHRTKRPQNACRRCGYMWYPRGKNVSHSCPRCGSRDVELAFMAVFRAIGAMFVALALCLKVLLDFAVVVVSWVWKRITALVAAAQKWFANRSARRRAGLSGSTPHSRRTVPSSPPTGSNWARRAWSATCGSVAAFFTWVASVNDDITGVNDNPNAFGLLAKLLVILILAGTVFAMSILAARRLGLV